MRLVLSFGKSLTLVAALTMTLSATGCGQPAADTETAPSSDLGAEAGSTTGGGAEVPAAGGDE